MPPERRAAQEPGEASNKLPSLQPVKFHYKKAPGPECHPAIRPGCRRGEPDHVSQDEEGQHSKPALRRGSGLDFAIPFNSAG